MREIGAGIGIATDGDARPLPASSMRTALLCSPTTFVALLFDYLVESRGLEKRRRQIRGHD